MLDRLLALEAFGIKLGLENITRLCAALGHPERAFASLHVAGTNGKGSVTAMVHTALVAAGVRAARYTSPHLVNLAERFVIGPAAVSEDTLGEVAAHVLDCADRLHAEGALQARPTFFEATTAIAFELFRRADVEVAVIETGLGGRFDATNVLAPAVSAITSIGFDHQQHLGNTLEAIAFEKAGIIKPGVPLIVGPMPPGARAVIDAVASERAAPVIDAAANTTVSSDEEDGRTTIVATTPAGRYGPLTLALRGAHQIDNARVALQLLETVRETGVHVPADAIARGLTEVHWPARLEIVRIDGGRRVVLDAAHNVEGARALAAYLERWHPERPPLVIGVMRDKDLDGMLGALLPVVSSVTATAAPMPRAMPAQELASRTLAHPAARRAASDVRAEPNPIRAVEAALDRSATVCVAGSIVLAGAVRDGLQRRAILR